MNFRVATYNILCSHLVSQKRFPTCDPSNLEESTRLERIKQKLEGEVDEGAVICLQEVSSKWAGDLHAFFVSRGYTFIGAHYGVHSTGYMGVALAWPLDKFEALSVDITRLSDTRKWGKNPNLDADKKRPSPLQSTEWSSPWRIFSKLTGMGEERSVARAHEPATRKIEPEYLSWKNAKKRQNQALFARLRQRKSSSEPNEAVFCVGTFHMPCMFTDPPAMVILTSLVIKHLARLAGSDPLIFAADFNFSPGSGCYELATEGDLSSSNPDFPEAPKWEKQWSPTTGVKLLSAYREVEGKEPNFTNNAKMGSSDPFIDTLDYIFHTSGVTTTKVRPLQHRDEVQGPFPTAEEPSDHVLLTAEFKMGQE